MMKKAVALLALFGAVCTAQNPAETCPDEYTACTGDADCGAILAADEFDMSASMANTLCAEMMNCQADGTDMGSPAFERRRCQTFSDGEDDIKLGDDHPCQSRLFSHDGEPLRRRTFGC